MSFFGKNQKESNILLQLSWDHFQGQPDYN